MVWMSTACIWRLAPAFGRDLGRGQNVRAIPLFQRLKDRAELGSVRMPVTVAMAGAFSVVDPPRKHPQPLVRLPSEVRGVMVLAKKIIHAREKW